MPLKTITLPLAQIKPYPGNAKIHTEAQIEELAAFIEKTGYLNRILVDEDGVILAGHGRRLALMHLGWEEAECEQATGLSEAEKRKVRLFDNRIAEKGQTDEAALLEELLALADMGEDLAGYGREDLDALLEQYTNPQTLAGLLGGPDGGEARPSTEPQGIAYRQKFAVLIECPSEAEQEKTYNELQRQGYPCKVLVN